MTEMMLNPILATERVPASVAAAPGGWFDCRVHRAGAADDGHVYIALSAKNGAFPERWYFAHESYRKEMLATALVALTSGLIVNASLGSADAYSRINRLYVVR